MGTDIHLIAETKHYHPETREDLGWQMVPGPIIDCFSCEGTGIAHRWEGNTRVPGDKPCRWCAIDPSTWPDISADNNDGYDDREFERTRYVGPGKVRDSWFSDRNYIVFAVLGNVRNGTGFAGARTHTPLIPITDHRGWPADLSDEGKHWFQHRGGDHSESWAMLDEILRYDWDQGVHKTGVFDLASWAAYRESETGLPVSWSGDISGGSVRYVDHAEMDRQLKLFRAAHGRNPQKFGEDGIVYCTRMQWMHPLGLFAQHFLERMRELVAITGETPTRLVFDFDS